MIRSDVFRNVWTVIFKQKSTHYTMDMANSVLAFNKAIQSIKAIEAPRTR